MIKKLSSIWILLILITAYGCVKDTYDMEKLSGRGELTPSFVFPLFTGKAVLGDAVKQSDTVIYDNDNFVRLVLKKDSVINLGLRDYINIDKLVSFTDSYSVSEVRIDPFQGSMTFSLGTISDNFDPSLRDQLRSLDDGSEHPFPAFPPANIGTKQFTRFMNFQHAVFSSGFIDITVTNNLPAPLSGVQLLLSNSQGNVGTVNFSAVNTNQTRTETINLAGVVLTDTLTASVVLLGSEGNANPVIIDMDESSITFTATGRDLRVSSGRVVVPAQVVSEAGSSHLIRFDPGEGIELEQMRIITGNLKWKTTYNGSLNATLDITLPTITRNDAAFSEIIDVTQMNLRGAFSMYNTIAAFNSDVSHPYNKIQIDYTLRMNSNDMLVDFNSTDINLECSISDVEIDYIKAYLGKRKQSFTPTIMDLNKKMRNISGDLSFANPSLRIDYSNSFAVPVEVAFNARARKGDQDVDLNLAPFMIAYPDAGADRDVSSSLTVNKDNSGLSALLSLPPESVTFSGSAELNPAGDTKPRDNNYIFGNSRLIASVEMELPLDISLNNLQFIDTTENFLSDDDISRHFDPDDFELVKLGIEFQNGFPFDVAGNLNLYDSVTRTITSTIDIPELIKAAPATGGKATGVTESVATIVVPKEFFEAIDSSDQLIFIFRAVTPGAPGENVKIYSDYAIDFRVTAFVKARIRFDM